MWMKDKYGMEHVALRSTVVGNLLYTNISCSLALLFGMRIYDWHGSVGCFTPPPPNSCRRRHRLIRAAAATSYVPLPPPRHTLTSRRLHLPPPYNSKSSLRPRLTRRLPAASDDSASDDSASDDSASTTALNVDRVRRQRGPHRRRAPAHHRILPLLLRCRPHRGWGRRRARVHRINRGVPVAVK